MKKYHILNTMIENKLAVIIRGESPGEAVEIADACVEGGVRTMEVTFTVPGAETVIQTLIDKYPEHEIGAGTVLDPETARLAILRGARFIVSPYFNKETAKLCNRYSVPYLPGIMTVKEAQESVEYGVDVVKLFPGEAFGPSFIKSLLGPLPDLKVMPTGGVSLENTHEWLQAGAVMIGVGGAITKAGGSAEIKRLAAEFQQMAREG